MRNQIEDMVNDNHKDFVKAIISVEKGISDERALDKLYDAYMDNDIVNFIWKCKEISLRTFRREQDPKYIQMEGRNWHIEERKRWSIFSN